MEANANIADLREMENITVEVDAVSPLRVRERSVTADAFETRKARFDLLACLLLFDSSEEVGKGFIKASQNVLDDLRVDVSQRLGSLFEGRQSVLHLAIGQ